jgi:hypothetical protein
MNLANSKDEFKILVQYMEYKLLKQDNKKHETHYGRIVKKGLLIIWGKK